MATMRSTREGLPGLGRLAALREEAGLIVTHLEQPPALPPTPRLWFQGYAYGCPAALQPAARAAGFLRR